MLIFWPPPKRRVGTSKVVFWLASGYWGYGNEYQKEDNLDAYKAVVGNGISFIDTSEVCFACCLASQSCHVRFHHVCITTSMCALPPPKIHITMLKLNTMSICVHPVCVTGSNQAALIIDRFKLAQ